MNTNVELPSKALALEQIRAFVLALAVKTNNSSNEDLIVATAATYEKYILEGKAK